MKQLLEMLPKILGMMPEIVKYIKYLPIIMALAGVGYGIYYVTKNYRDPYMCHDNEIYEQISITSGVYKFKGGYCISDK